MKFNINFKNLKNGPRNVLLLLVFFAVCLGVLTRLTDYSRTTQTMTYAAFIKSVENNQIKSVHIIGNEAYGTFKDGKRFEAVIADNPNNWAILKEHGVDYSVGQPSAQLSFWHILFLLLTAGGILAVIYFIRQSRGSGGGSNIFSVGKSKAKMFMPSQIKTNFDSVAGAHEAKEALRDVVDFLKNPEKYRRLGAKLTRGILLVGEPGNGKTLLAKAVAGEANCPFISISGSDFIEIFVGVGAARTRDLFERARKNAPSIIFIDEIDAIGRQRGSGLGGGHDEREQALNQLLIEMDGFDSANIPVVVIAATNIPDVLDKALLRPGRFDRRIDVPFPDQAAREQILLIHLKQVKVAPDVDVALLATKTAGLSGSDLANLVNQAALHATRNNKELVEMADFDVAHHKILQSNEATADSGSLASSTRINSRAKVYMPHQIKVTFNDVAGMPEVKEDLQDIIDFLRNPDKYRRLGAKLTRGVLLAGNPGNGKTLLAKAVAGEANCPFFSVSGSEFDEVFIGVGQARMRDLFAQARKHSPSIIFIDEIDAVGGQRSSTPYRSDERDKTLNQLLVELDGFESSKSAVIIMGATNRADMLDKALLRPGRFDRQVHVPYPDVTSREAILRVHARGAHIHEAVDFQKIARGMPGSSGADLAHLVNEALIIAAKKNSPTATIEDFDEARDKIMLGRERRSLIRKPDELKKTAFHEAGHALIGLMLPQVTDPVYKVTIIARGPALGVTHWLPEDDKVAENKEQMLASIMCALGGRGAEELIFNEISSGAANDFEKATAIARTMICYYGMSEDLGPVFYNPQKFPQSEETSRKIDEEVRRVMKQCYQQTLELLTSHRDKLEILAKALLEKETLFAHEIYELLGIQSRTDHSIH